MRIVTSPGVTLSPRGGYRLGPGDYCAGQGDDLELVTVLGSCVAACLYDARAGIGGMNHFLLPGSRPADPGAATRYGSYAMERLINELLKLGAQRSRLQAKAFGGAAVLRTTTSDIGGVNSRFLRDYLQREGIPLVAEDLGGTVTRRVRFWPGYGKVRLERLSDRPARLDSTETNHLAALGRDPLEGEVELF